MIDIPRISRVIQNAKFVRVIEGLDDQFIILIRQNKKPSSEVLMENTFKCVMACGHGAHSPYLVPYLFNCIKCMFIDSRQRVTRSQIRFGPLLTASYLTLTQACLWHTCSLGVYVIFYVYYLLCSQLYFQTISTCLQGY